MPKTKSPIDLCGIFPDSKMTHAWQVRNKGVIKLKLYHSHDTMFTSRYTNYSDETSDGIERRFTVREVRGVARISDFADQRKWMQ